jgi:integrase
MLLAVTETAGTKAMSRIDRAAMEHGIERRNQYAARHFLQAMRGLFHWAVKAKHVDNDPTAELKVVLPATDGHHTWTDDECLAFEGRWPRGTRERVAFDVLLYTGLRRGDAVRLGRPHIKKWRCCDPHRKDRADGDASDSTSRTDNA